jgi:predicted PurR-regulated permease PerM
MAAAMSLVNVPARAIARIVLIVIAVILGLYLIYLLRKPILWLFLATFIAVALSTPVNRLSRHMKRGFAIAVVYFGVLLIPVLLAIIVIPPIVNQAADLARNAPRYSRDVTKYIQDNKRLRKLNDKYDITAKLEKEAGKLPSKAGDAAKVLRDVGFGLVNSIFALVTITILSIFMLSAGGSWLAAFMRLHPPDRARRLDRALRHMARAVAAYVAGALAQAAIAGITTYVVLLILGVPFRAPLAVLVFFFDLIPLVGATIAAVLVGIVTLFNDFPTDTIVWVVWAIVYQQVENTVIQPQIQGRAIEIQPFVVLVAVLFGATLLGVIGALVALPVAASIQIGVREWLAYRREAGDPTVPPPAPPPPAVEPPPAPAGG